MSTIYITSRGDAFTLDQLVQNRLGRPIHVSLTSVSPSNLAHAPYETHPPSPAARAAA